MMKNIFAIVGIKRGIKVTFSIQGQIPGGDDIKTSQNLGCQVYL